MALDGRIAIKGTEDVAYFRSRLTLTAQKTREMIARLLTSRDWLVRLKFERLGCHPLDTEVPQNVAEQIDQQATYDAALDAVEWLIQSHPGRTWQVAPGANSTGHDITSADGSVVAEVFAAVDPVNDRKLAKDTEKVRAATAPHRYVFYRSPLRPESFSRDGDVTIVALGMDRKAGIAPDRP